MEKRQKKDEKAVKEDQNTVEKKAEEKIKRQKKDDMEKRQ